ncbi:Transmembrane protein [Gammaproteobacteria bacterium]
MSRRLMVMILFFGMRLALATESLPGLVHENVMKAAYLFNFAVLTEWPKPFSTLNLCISAEEDLAQALNSIVGKKVRGMDLNLVRLVTWRDISHCHILFLGEVDRLQVRDLLNRLRDSPVLTVTDVEGMMVEGVMIGILESADRLTFEVNLAASRRAGLIISSKLLHLARRVLSHAH